MPAKRLLFEPGTLPATIADRTAKALEQGVLQSIRTEAEFIQQAGVRFLVRIISNLARKDGKRKLKAAGSAAKQGVDPFAPPEKALFLTDISSSHFCLLNKFNVLEEHLLIVTRDFEHQENLLTLDDFLSLWVCMAECDGLGFYNSGKVAGASQIHKHLQVVPLPLAPEGPGVPIEPLLTAAKGQEGVVTDLPLPFQHAFTWLDTRLASEHLEAAVAALSRYRAMMEALGLLTSPPPPYNLLVTQKWMLLVPRGAEKFERISVNALGFAGALLVKNEEQLHRVKKKGPMTILRKVAMPPAARRAH